MGTLSGNHKLAIKKIFASTKPACVMGLLAVLYCSVLMSGPAAADASKQKFPDVVAATIHIRNNHEFDFDVTVSSPYATAQRYADAFRVMNVDGIVYGERILLHDHANEPPFTRDLYGVTIPPGVRFVVIQARDKKFGYGGKSLQLPLPGR